jgi:hypothetical protein
MKLSRLIVFVAFALLSNVTIKAQTDKQIKELKKFSVFLKDQETRNYKKLIQTAAQKGWPLQMALRNGGYAKLTGIYANGMPEYTATESNVGAANTTGASALWNGGVSGLNLTGSSTSLNGKIAIWDGGALLGSHQELNGRIIAGDAAASISDHATHVAGTMIAKGINPFAKGMLYNINNLTSYDFNSDNGEMAAGAANFLLSNHSYGSISGWRLNNTTWEFWGEWNATEDFKFGFYDNKSRYWDSISFLAPNYLIVKSAGNNRNENGPNVGQTYSRFNQNNQMLPAGSYAGGISPNNSYGIISTYGNAKNILTVGAVGILNNGYTNTNGVVMSSFSSWGPTDDGRIKPDIVAAGVDLLSSIGTGTASYDTYSGTSMSSPNATGSLGLLQEFYNRETSTFMKAATLKALAIHTAEESGTNDGPDYQFGWGLLNVKKGTDVIKGRNLTHRILENNLANTATFSLNTISSGGAKFVATIVWTDPAATVDNVNYLNNTTAKLINDLDIRVVTATGTEQPWKLDGANPINPAIKGDNNKDNVEKIEILNPIPGENYEVRVTHKGALANSSQNYSLILSGVGGTAYCASQPTSNSNSRIDNITFGGINRNAVGCTQYTNATNLFASAYPSQVVPFTITLGTCGIAVNKIAKIFIDWNIDGDFVDAGELVATSAVIGATGAFVGNITIPNTITVGSSTRMRVVLSETTDATTINPCGTYAFGETLDVSLKITAALNDAKTIAVNLPEVGACATDFTFVSATMQNVGTNTLSNIPLRAIVLDGATTVATLLDTIKSAVAPNSFADIIFRTTFASQPGKSYTIRVNTDAASEQIRLNDTLTVERLTAVATVATITNAKAQLCTATQANLSATTNTGNLYWYTTAVGGNVVATGTTTTTNIVPANNTYYIGVNDAKGSVGPVNKNVLGTSGGYAAFSNVQNIITYSPLVIENLRMYFGTGGTIEILVREAASGNIVAQSSFNVNATSSTPGSGTNDINDPGIVLPVNLKILNPGAYTIGCNFSNGVQAFRHNPITGSPYPYTLGGLMDITSSNNGTGLTSYYWVYDLKVRALGCASTAARVQVVADPVITPLISQAGAVLTSSETGAIYQWYNNGSPVANSNTQSITITVGGSYTVTVTKGGCQFTSTGFAAVFTSITNINPADVKLTILPNPIKHKAIVQFSTSSRENVTLDIVTLDGKKIQTQQFVVNANTVINKVFDLTNLAAGTYMLRIYYDGKQVVKKLIKE